MQTAHNGVAVRMLRADRTDRLSSWLENAAPVLTVAIVCGSVLGLWVLPLRSSLWTDETGTVWALRGTLQEALYRAWVYPGQPSALYTVLAWLTAAAGGLHEATLRLPSLLAMVLSAVVLYRLGLRFGDSFQGLLAVAVFATYRTVIFAASDARPYAFALLAVLAAALTIVKWCETGRPRYGLLFILSAAASVWLHYLSAATLAVDAALVLWWPSRNRPRPIVLLLAGTAVLLLLAPLASHSAHLWHDRAQHSWAGTPSFRDLVIDVLYLRRLVAGLLGGFCIARLLYPGTAWRRSGSLALPAPLFAIWYILPVSLCFMTARLTDAQVFVPRYYIWGVPGLALLTAFALSGLSNPSARRLVGLATVVVLCARPFPSGASAHGGEDWRGALQAAAAVTERSRAPLLLCSGFPEEIVGRAEEPVTLDNPLTTPLAMYPVHTDVFLGPNNLEETGRKRLETIVSRVLLARGTFVLVSRMNAEPIDVWLRGRFAGEPYTVRSLGEFPGITTLIFERSGPSASVR